MRNHWYRLPDHDDVGEESREFRWGYGGTGPRALGRSMLSYVLPGEPDLPLSRCAEFTWLHIATVHEQAPLRIRGMDIVSFLGGAPDQP